MPFIFRNVKLTILNFQLSPIKLSVVRKYEVGSLFTDKGIRSLHLNQTGNNEGYGHIQISSIKICFQVH